MWSPHQTPEPIEKIRTTKWSEENTRLTQIAVDRVFNVIKALKLICGPDSVAILNCRAAIERFCKLDPKVKRPW